MFTYVQKRERAFRNSIGYEDRIYKSLYTDLRKFGLWHSTVDKTSEFGGVYNLEFSPDGSLMVAACEKKAMVLFDPISNKQIKAVKNAHQDSVNCVKFLTNTIFATCSDDSTVALWDKRNLSTKVRSLHGHMNWVKNIEYSTRDSLLVTSGFDGSIFTWDINATTEQGFVYKKVFHTPGLMRCRLSPDSKQLVICTTGGYLIIIHDLDLINLADDLRGFKPNVYRLMQLGRQFIPTAARYDHVFTKSMKRNRVELVSDFPNDAEVITSLQIHPHGWCALSRNISYDESSEFSCLHDIQQREHDEDVDDCDSEGSRQRKTDPPTIINIPRRISVPASVITANGGSLSNLPTILIVPNRSSVLNLTDSYGSIASNEPSANGESSRNGEANRSNGSSGTGGASVAGGSSGPSGSNESSRSVGPNASIERIDLTEAIEDGVRPPPPPPPPTSRPTTRHRGAFHSPHMDIWAAEVTLRDRLLGDAANNDHREPDTEPTAPGADTNSYRYTYMTKKSIPQNVRRMLYYIEQPNKGQGLIKEECFSSCGRLVCSPYGFGFRLLAYLPDCSELPRALENRTESRLMTEVLQTVEHKDIVVSTRFSPTQPLLATGCLQGRIHWHYPRI